MKRCAIWSGAARGVRFVWIMGADNLRSFHRWQRWREIARLVPIAVVDRLGPSLYATAGIAGQAFAYARLPRIGGEGLAGTKAAGLALLAWPEIAAVLYGAAGGTGPALTIAAGIDCNNMTARQLIFNCACPGLQCRLGIL